MARWAGGGVNYGRAEPSKPGVEAVMTDPAVETSYTKEELERRLRKMSGSRPRILGSGFEGVRQGPEIVRAHVGTETFRDHGPSVGRRILFRFPVLFATHRRL